MSYEQLKDEKLNNPILLISSYGWSDAGYAASSAIKYLIKSKKASKIAKINSEKYIDFSQNRPKVLIKNDKRYIKWPDSFFYSIKMPDEENDIILFLTHEPNFYWNDFSGIIKNYCNKNSVVATIFLGGLLAETTHYKKITLLGNSSSSMLTKKVKFNLTSSNKYEGPTGIMGVMTKELESMNMQHASIWANIPYYLNSITNPKGAQAILNELNKMLPLNLDLKEINDLSSKFDGYLENILDEHPEIKQITERLQNIDVLPDTDDVISELDTFYKNYFDNNSDDVISELDEFYKNYFDNN